MISFPFLLRGQKGKNYISRGPILLSVREGRMIKKNPLDPVNPVRFLNRLILKQEGCHVGDYLQIISVNWEEWSMLKLYGIFSVTERKQLSDLVGGVEIQNFW